MIDPNYQGESIVFIVGCGRSGTTWLQRILASHPHIHTGQETNLFKDYLGPQLLTWRKGVSVNKGRRGGIGLACYFDYPQFSAILRSYMLALMEPMVGSLAPGEFFLEKTPSHALFLPDILEYLLGRELGAAQRPQGDQDLAPACPRRPRRRGDAAARPVHRSVV
jgi:hypothetical protein